MDDFKFKVTSPARIEVYERGRALVVTVLGPGDEPRPRFKLILPTSDEGRAAATENLTSILEVKIPDEVQRLYHYFLPGTVRRLGLKNTFLPVILLANQLPGAQIGLEQDTLRGVQQYLIDVSRLGVSPEDQLALLSVFDVEDVQAITASDYARVGFLDLQSTAASLGITTAELLTALQNSSRIIVPPMWYRDP